jgi:uncharacterized protein YcbK (DUF882 family)
LIAAVRTKECLAETAARALRALGFGAAMTVLLGGGAAWADAPAPPGKAPKHASAKKKKRSKTPAFAGRLATSDELRKEPLEKPSGKIVLTAVNFKERVEVSLYKEDGGFDPEALDTLNHVFRCRRTGTEKAIEPRLFEMLSRIYDRFQRPLELVSGFRNQERVSSFHFHGSASDVRIAGVSEKELHRFVTSLDPGGMGIGLYPRAGFVHVDIRPEASYRWTDYSPPGKGDSVARGSFINKKKSKKRASARNT